jgi:hypothetical protein
MRRLAWLATSLALLGAGAGALAMLHASSWRLNGACSEFVERCMAFEKEGSARRIPDLIFCASVLDSLAQTNPKDATGACSSLLLVLDQAPLIGWRRAMKAAGFARLSTD